MNPQETADFTAFVSRLRTEEGLTVLLIEHDMRVVMGVSDRVTVLDYGEKIAEGAPQEVQKRPEGDRGVPRLRGGVAVTETVAERERVPGRPTAARSSSSRTSTPTTGRSRR